MKQSSKNWIWIAISIASFIIFLFATLIVGFKFNEYGPTDTDLDLLIRFNSHDNSYTDPTIALLVVGLCLSFLAIIFVLVKSIIDISKFDLNIANEIWDYTFLALIDIASILLISGSAYYLSSVVNTLPKLIKVNPGNTSMLFMLLIIPMLFSILPLSLDWHHKRKTAKKPKKHHKKTK